MCEGQALALFNQTLITSVRLDPGAGPLKRQSALVALLTAPRISVPGQPHLLPALRLLPAGGVIRVLAGTAFWWPLLGSCSDCSPHGRPAWAQRSACQSRSGGRMRSRICSVCQPTRLRPAPAAGSAPTTAMSAWTHVSRAFLLA